MLEAETLYFDNRRTNYLVRHHVPSRVHAQDAMLFDFDPNVRSYVGRYFGWSTLASKPPVDIAKISDFAKEVRDEGLTDVVLIGQGGSSQAATTLTSLQTYYDDSVKFHTMDSVSPFSVDRILSACDPATTLYIVSSKSGSTVEPTVLMRISWKQVCDKLGEQEAGGRFVAITDPGSDLERIARRNRWRAIFPGATNVGGRYSALSVFGLLPAALVGIDLRRLIAEARRWEVLCSGDFIENPAVQLASFLYENQQSGRRYFSFISPQAGRVFGLWVEQLIAESLGKNGNGILPNIETDAQILSVPRDDRCAITYAIHPDASFLNDIDLIDPSIPVIHYAIPNVYQVACHFIMWEYATAFTAVLMHVNPFDQPDVQSTKSEVKRILSENEDVSITPGCHQIPDDDGVVLEAEVSPAVTNEKPADLDEALEALFTSVHPGDYFSTNAFLPFYPQDRRLPLEEIRHCMAAHLGVVSSLEIGPRYLHSTGQLHKGGPNTGVFLILSADESVDIEIPGESYTLDTLVHAQACGDMAALSSKGRRVLRIHLSDDKPETLAHISARICAAACKVAAGR